MATTPAPNPLLQLSPSQVNRAPSAQWKQIIKHALMDARFSSPAFLEEDMDAQKQTVTVRIALQEQVRTNTGPQWWDVPPIILVPICLPRGGGFSLTLPLKKGDEGLLIFCDTCFDLWWANGQNNSPVAQNTGVVSGSQRQNEIRRHDIHDCGFYPGMWSQPNVLTDWSTDSAQLRRDDGSAYVDVASEIVTVSGSSEVDIEAPAVNVSDGTGTPQALMTDTFYQWWITNIYPFLQSKGYSGVPPPITGSETTVLKGQ